MRKNLLSFILCLIMLIGQSTSLLAQFERVEFDYTYAYFNNGQALPAEQSMVLIGQAASGIDRVEVRIHRANTKPEKAPLFLGTWKRQAGATKDIFRIPVSYKLAGSSAYDLRFVYFRSVSEAEKENLEETLLKAIKGYIRQSIDIKGEKARIQKNPQAFVDELDALVNEGLRYYRSMSELQFAGFSDLVKEAYASLNKMSEGEVSDGARRVESLLYQELAQILNTEMVVRTDVREVLGYETERTRRTIALNVGYGGVFTEWRNNNFSYVTAPYVGLSLPLANPALSGRFWSNTSISLGVFTQNFTEDSTTLTGPIFGRPYYLGLGYNVFRFIRINAGVTALERQDATNGGSLLNVESVFLRPFIGVSAEFDLWLGLKEKR